MIKAQEVHLLARHKAQQFWDNVTAEERSSSEMIALTMAEVSALRCLHELREAQSCVTECSNSSYLRGALRSARVCRKLHKYLCPDSDIVRYSNDRVFTTSANASRKVCLTFFGCEMFKVLWRRRRICQDRSSQNRYEEAIKESVQSSFDGRKSVISLIVQPLDH